MLRNHCLAKSIADAAWGSFFSMLKYKAVWYGRTFYQIDKWFASSKTCFDCKHKVKKLPLDIRAWTCPSCNSHHDRDFNAALNIEARGLEELERLRNVVVIAENATKKLGEALPSELNSALQNLIQGGSMSREAISKLL